MDSPRWKRTKQNGTFRWGGDAKQDLIRCHQQENDNNTPMDATVETAVAEGAHTDTRTLVGFKATLEKLHYVATKPEIVERELLWQMQGRGGNIQAQAEFKEEILAQRNLSTFTIMCDNSPFLTICHSVRKFFAEPGDKNKGLHGKCIAFVGDCVQSHDPQVVILSNLVWDWINPEVFTDYEILEENYHSGNGNQAKLFNPPDRATVTAISTPLKNRLREKERRRKGIWM